MGIHAYGCMGVCEPRLVLTEKIIHMHKYNMLGRHGSILVEHNAKLTY